MKGRATSPWEDYGVDPRAPLRTWKSRRCLCAAGQVLDMRVEESHVSNPHDGIARVDGYVIDIEGPVPWSGKNVQVEITKVFRTYAKGKVVAPGA